MEPAFFEGLGLTRNESKVYLALLRAGVSSPSDLMNRTDLHRSRVYDALQRLMAKGLVSTVKMGKQSQYEATEAEKLLDALEEEKARLEQRKDSLLKALPQIRKLSEGQARAEAHVLSGIEGFKAMRRDVLRHAGRELLLIGAISLEDRLMPNFFNWWNNQRIAKNMRLRILHKESARGKAMTHLEASETRFLPPNIDNPVVINVYGDRVVSLIWKGEHPTIFLLINQDIADAYRKYFSLLWRLSKP